MTDITPESPHKRDMYVSDGTYFTYNQVKDEFGTNRRNPATAELARAALRGIDFFDEQTTASGEGIETPGVATELVSEESGAVEGLRIDSPRLLQQGLQAILGLPASEVTPDIRSLVYGADRDLYAFVQDLALRRIIGRK